MRTCHACQRELDAPALAAGRCGHCGAVVRMVAMRTIEDKLSPRPDNDNDGGNSDDPSSTPPSIDLPPLAAVPPGPTIAVSQSDTANEPGPEASPPPPPILSTTERRAPTLGDQGDFTVDLSSLATPIQPTIPEPEPPKKKGRRSTQTLESDRTVDFDSSSSAEAKDIESKWKGTFDHGSRQGQTIRQKETVSGFRSSLPVKSRYVREKHRNGGAVHATPAAEAPDYELLEILGEGGMGVVYSARQSSIARTVAVKMLKPGAKIRDEQRDKFISEAVVTGELDHPNIVPIYDLGANEQGALFYSMKRVRGTPWDKVIGQKQIDENLGILLRVADAVAFAHDRGVIHRDLKPENVMLGDYGEVLVMDWGLARIAPGFAHVDTVYQVDSLGGTPAYMAPEMARGPIESIDKTSDIYLLGAILYEIIGGEPPHSGRDVMQCLMAASQNRIDPIRYEGELKDIALQAMASLQEDRYPSVKEFQEAVRLYQSHSESLVLTAHASQNLRKARESNEYQLFARALYGFQEALTLWDTNHRAKALLTETQHDYAKCALGKGDLDLAASLLDSDQPEHQPLQTQIDAARRERNARARRLRMAKLSVAALIAGIIATVTIAYFQVSSARDIAEVQRDAARVAQQEEAAAKEVAVSERNAANAAKEQEAAAREAEMAQRIAAEEAKEKEAAAREAETLQRIAAEKAQKEEAIARAKAEEEELRALAAEQVAIKAKQAEEYEAYVASIGLAAAKIDENAYDFAAHLLNDSDQKLQNWEWGRLAHLCQLSAGSYNAQAPVDMVAFSPDGQSFASGDRNGKVTVGDVHYADSSPLVSRFQVPHGQNVMAVAYSPDGRRIATGSSDSSIQILDATNGQVLKTLRGHTDGVLTVRFSPDGRQLLSGSFDNTARLWDLATGETKQLLKGHSWWVWAAEFSPDPDANRIVTAGQDGKAIVWEKVTAEGARRRAEARSDAEPLPVGSYELAKEFTGHDGAVYSARFSPDGELVATGGYDKLVMVWNPDEVPPIDYDALLQGEEAAKPNYLRLAGHDGPVRSVAFSPKGSLVLSGGEDNAIRLWEVANGKAVKSLRGHGSEVRSCVFSPDGQWVLSGSKDDHVRLWNIQGYQESRVLHATVFDGHADAVLSARYSDDGTKIVTASRDRTAILWNAETGEQLRQFHEGHDFLASNAAFFPDARRLATGAGDNSVRIWDLTTGTQLHALPNTGRIGVVAVAPEGDWLVTGSPGGDLQVWDSNSGRLLGKLAGHQDEVSALAFSATGDLLASGDEQGHIRVWRRGGPATMWTFEKQLDAHNGSITGLRFTPDGRRLVSASGDRSCAQWDLASGQENRQLVLKHPDWVSSLDLSADGSLAVTTCDDGRARLWRLSDARELASVPPTAGKFTSACFAPDGLTAVVTSPDGKLVQRWTLPPRTPEGEVASATGQLETILDFNVLRGLIWSTMFAPDGSHILTLGGNDVQLWNLDSRRATVRLSPHGAVASAAISPDGRIVATGSWDHSAKLWDAATGLAIRKLDGAHAGYINTVEFSPDHPAGGARGELLTASDDHTARLWDVATGTVKSDVVFRGHQARVLSATYSPDATRVLTTGGDATAQIWDRATGQSLTPLAGHKWAVLCGRFSPDGKRVITGSEDNTARIWDAATGEELYTLQGHTAAITAVAFSPDGSRALTGSRDNTVKLWDAQTGKEILSLPGHTQEVTAVSFSPDGRNVLTASRDGTAIIWLANDWREDAPILTAHGR